MAKYKVRIEFPKDDGGSDYYDLDVLPRVGDFVKGTNNRYYRILAVIHCVNDQAALPKYELRIKPADLPKE